LLFLVNVAIATVNGSFFTEAILFSIPITANACSAVVYNAIAAGVAAN